jgi:hypothetical protein
MTIREKLAAFKAAVEPVASGELRYPLTTAEAVALVAEVGTAGLRCADDVAKAAAEFEALPERPADDSALVEWALKRKAAEDGFWSHFHGEEIDGVSVIRRG